MEINNLKNLKQSIKEQVTNNIIVPYSYFYDQVSSSSIKDDFEDIMDDLVQELKLIKITITDKVGDKEHFILDKCSIEVKNHFKVNVYFSENYF